MPTQFYRLVNLSKVKKATKVFGGYQPDTQEANGMGAHHWTQHLTDLDFMHPFKGVGQDSILVERLNKEDYAGMEDLNTPIESQSYFNGLIPDSLKQVNRKLRKSVKGK